MVVLEAMQDHRKRKVPLDAAHERLGRGLSFITDIDIVPAGELAHGGLETGMVKVEIAIFPGGDFTYVDMGQDAEGAFIVEDGLLSGMQEDAGAGALGKADAAVDQGSALGGFIGIGHDIE